MNLHSPMYLSSDHNSGFYTITRPVQPPVIPEACTIKQVCKAEWSIPIYNVSHELNDGRCNGPTRAELVVVAMTSDGLVRALVHGFLRVDGISYPRSSDDVWARSVLFQFLFDQIQ